MQLYFVKCSCLEEAVKYKKKILICYISPKIQYFIGLGDPIEGPGMIEALSRGSIILQPQLEPPLNLGSIGKPSNRTVSSCIPVILWTRLKKEFLHPIQQPGLYWDGISVLPLVKVRTHTWLTACDLMKKIANHWAKEGQFLYCRKAKHKIKEIQQQAYYFLFVFFSYFICNLLGPVISLSFNHFYMDFHATKMSRSSVKNTHPMIHIAYL